MLRMRLPAPERPPLVVIHRGGPVFLHLQWRRSPLAVCRSDNKNRNVCRPDHLVGNAPKPCAPDPAASVGGHDDEICAYFASVACKGRDDKSLKYRSRQQPAKTLPQRGGDRPEVITVCLLHG